MRWRYHKQEEVTVGDIVVKEFFAFIPIRSWNHEGIIENRWLEKVIVEYNVYEKENDWAQNLGKKIEKRFSYLHPIKFLN